MTIVNYVRDHKLYNRYYYNHLRLLKSYSLLECSLEMSRPKNRKKSIFYLLKVLSVNGNFLIESVNNTIVLYINFSLKQMTCVWTFNVISYICRIKNKINGRKVKINAFFSVIGFIPCERANERKYIKITQKDPPFDTNR